MDTLPTFTWSEDCSDFDIIKTLALTYEDETEIEQDDIDTLWNDVPRDGSEDDITFEQWWSFVFSTDTAPYVYVDYISDHKNFYLDAIGRSSSEAIIRYVKYTETA